MTTTKNKEEAPPWRSKGPRRRTSQVENKIEPVLVPNMPRGHFCAQKPLRLYRISYVVSVLVEARSQSEAREIAEHDSHAAVVGELADGFVEEDCIDEICSPDELWPTEVGSLPWRSRDRHAEPEVNAEVLAEALCEGDGS